MRFRILHQDEWLVAVDKPAGFQVHQPEDQRHRVSRSFDCLFQLRRQIDRYVYPVHRLDRATSGVLLFALDAETARLMCELFQSHQLTKSYYCVTRGWSESEGAIDRENDGKPALTHYQRIGSIELPHPVGPYASARYSLVRAEPHTGRMHQIRRHLAQISHPLIGDTIYGDGKHNRFFSRRTWDRFASSESLFARIHASQDHSASSDPSSLELALAPRF